MFTGFLAHFYLFSSRIHILVKNYYSTRDYEKNPFCDSKDNGFWQHFVVFSQPRSFRLKSKTRD